MEVSNPWAFDIDEQDYMRFEQMSAKELFDYVTQFDEGKDWEFKGADFLEKDKHELRKELGKQVSAFANTGGGCIILGIHQNKANNQYTMQPIPLTCKGHPMQDYLAAQVEQAVDYPVQGCSFIHCRTEKDSQKGLVVIDVPDSPIGPHQCKEDKLYYWRIGSSSKPAPHFHLELLRQRKTATVLQIQDVIPQFFQLERLGLKSLKISLNIYVVIRNITMSPATAWGVHVKSFEQKYRWIDQESDRSFSDGFSIHGDTDVILPDEECPLKFTCTAIVDTLSPARRESREIDDAWESLVFAIRPVSQNHIGAEVSFPPTDANLRTVRKGVFLEDARNAIRW